MNDELKAVVEETEKIAEAAFVAALEAESVARAAWITSWNAADAAKDALVAFDKCVAERDKK